MGLMFVGSEHCSHCGTKAIAAEVLTDELAGNCPRCLVKLDILKVGDTPLRECTKCAGLWSSVETFENICADTERQSSVLAFAWSKEQGAVSPEKIRYVPCPDCGQLMNRSNFARSSGVIIDLCRDHGVWFDAEELPKIIEFIRKGGMERAREREKLEIKNERDRLRDDQRNADKADRFGPLRPEYKESIQDSFISFLFD